MQAAEEELARLGRGQLPAAAASVTQVQMLEMACSEADRRCAIASRYASS